MSHSYDLSRFKPFVKVVDAMRRFAERKDSPKRELNDTNSSFHPTCFACGAKSSNGLQLKFQQRKDSVICNTTIDSAFQSYQGFVHGGIITTLLDSAMVNCIHSLYEEKPFTCHLDIRFRHPIPTGVPVDIHAHVVSKRSKLCIAEADVLSNNELCAHARGKFMLKKNQ